MKTTTAKLSAIIFAILCTSQINAFPVCLSDTYGAVWSFKVTRNDKVYNAVGKVTLGGGQVWNAWAFWNNETKQTELHAINPKLDGCASGYADSFVNYGTGQGYLNDSGMLIMEGSGTQINYCNGLDIAETDWAMTTCTNNTFLANKTSKKISGIANGKLQDSNNFRWKIAPNPLINFTAIEYSLGQQAALKIIIYNYAFQPVKTLVNETHVKGTYKLTWDGRDANGNMVIAGVYNVVAIVNGKSFSALIQVIH